MISANDEVDDEDAGLHHAVNYLRFLLDNGLSREEIKEIAKNQYPTIEPCFEGGSCIAAKESLEPGRHIVLIG